jgi:RNA polymerase sigma factor (sigma-70 family)
LLRVASDERLVAAVRAGSEPAFEAIYDRHHRVLLSFCRHMLGSADEAADAVQHTFVAAYRDLTTSDKPIRLRPWLFAIARNRCLSMLRARRDHVDVELANPATEGLSAQVVRRQELRDLLADVGRLPEDQRAALVLAELGAVPHGEIAEILDCPREKVKALVFQARSSLAADREAREAPCQEIREELSVLRGGALRRSHLRRHLRQCDGCRAFRDEVRRQRSAMAVVLPVVPAVGLKHSVLSAVGGGGGAAGAASAGGATAGALGAQALAVKALVAVTVVAGAGLGARAVVDRVTESSGPAVAPHVERASDGVRPGLASGLPGVAAAFSTTTTHPAGTHVSTQSRGHSPAAATHGKKSVAAAGAPGRERPGGPHTSNAGNRGHAHQPAGGGGNGHAPKGNAYGRVPHESRPPPHRAPVAPPVHPSTPTSNGGGAGSGHANVPAHGKSPGASDPAGSSGL